MLETRVQSLGWEDLLEKEMATHFNILFWKVPWTEEPGRLQSMGSQSVGQDWVTLFSVMLEWVAVSFSRGSTWPRDRTCVSCTGRSILYCWSTREALICRVHIVKCQSGWITNCNHDYWRNINNIRYSNDTTLMEEHEKELKNFWWQWKRRVKKLVWNTELQIYHLITSWKIEDEKLEAGTDFIFLGSKITVDGHCSHEVKWCLFLRRKGMTNIDSVLKSRDKNQFAYKGLS